MLLERITIAVVPPNRALEDAVRDAGATVGDPADADGLVWTDPFHPEGLERTLRSSPARWVQLPFAGIEAFVEAGVVGADRTWTCAKGIYGTATAELAVGLLFAGARQIHRHARARGWWRGTRDAPHVRVAGTTALVIGTGGIGRALGRMLPPLGVEVVALNRSGAPMPGAARTERIASLGEWLRRADWVIVAAALTPETEQLIDERALAAMRPHAWLINVARGRLVDTDALVRALQAGSIGGAALDVTDPEPLPDDHPLWMLDAVIITSHTANTGEMALPELRALVTRNVARFARDEPLEGLVDVALGY